MVLLRLSFGGFSSRDQSNAIVDRANFTESMTDDEKHATFIHTESDPVVFIFAVFFILN